MSTWRESKVTAMSEICFIGTPASVVLRRGVSYAIFARVMLLALRPSSQEMLLFHKSRAKDFVKSGMNTLKYKVHCRALSSPPPFVTSH